MTNTSKVHPPMPFLCRIGFHKPMYPFRREGPNYMDWAMQDYIVCARCHYTETLMTGWVYYPDWEGCFLGDGDYLRKKLVRKLHEDAGEALAILEDIE